jgi:hypothetical protein
VKAIYRSWAIPCTDKQVYALRHRSEWLGKISESGVRRRAEFYYQQLDALRLLRQEVRREKTRGRPGDTLLLCHHRKEDREVQINLATFL